MPDWKKTDWKKEVREHLADIDLPAEAKEDVISELAAHLEDSDEDTNLAAKDELSMPKWRQLSLAISRAKRGNPMNLRRSLWLPMFVNLMLTSSFINLADWFGRIDLRIYRSDHIPLTPQMWLLALPFCGATAAFLAKRADGSTIVRLIAALTPCAVWFTVPFLLELLFLSFPHSLGAISLRSLAVSSFALIALPAPALLLGAAPFLGTTRPKVRCE